MADLRDAVLQHSMSTYFLFSCSPSHCGLSSETATGPSSCRIWRWADLPLTTSTHHFLCQKDWHPAQLAAAFPAVTASAATSSTVTVLALLLPLWSNPLTFNCTDKWISQVGVLVWCTEAIFSVMDVWFVANQRRVQRVMIHTAMIRTLFTSYVLFLNKTNVLYF